MTLTAEPSLDLCNEAQARQFSGCVVMMRDDLGMSDEAIAERVGVTCDAIARIAARIDRPSVKQLGEAWKVLLASATRANCR